MPFGQKFPQITAGTVMALSVMPNAQIHHPYTSPAPGLELRDRNTTTYYEPAANGTQLSISEPTDRVPFESNTGMDSNPPPQQRSTTAVATLSVDRRAIMIVIASFLLTFTGCGLNFAFGVYQELYETPSGPFHGNVSPAKIDLIGTLAVSLMTIGAPFASAWTRIYSPRTVTLCGGVLFALANIVASFGTRLWHFTLTQGFLLGCGTCLSYIPAVTVAPGWFDQRRGLAMGIILSGTGVGGVVWAPLLRYLNAVIGFRNTMRATGTLAFVLIALSALVLKWEHTADLQRRQENETRAARQRRFNIPLANWNIVRSRTFAAQATGAILQAAAYYTPI
jgi:MFS family permease